MNYYISVLYRAIPLLMGAFTFAYGFYTWRINVDANVLTAHILLSLTAICICLFTTAATIIRQLIKRYNVYYKYGLPCFGYAVALFTIGSGIYIMATTPFGPVSVVSGNVVMGVGFIASCVATVATASTRFVLIPENHRKKEGLRHPKAFTKLQGNGLIVIPTIAATICVVRGILLATDNKLPDYVGGHVLIGLGFICASLIYLVYTVVRQTQNDFYSERKWIGSIIVFTNGVLCILLGLWVLHCHIAPVVVAPGFVLIGLGLICWSISSKVILLALVWHQESAYAKNIPLIPIFTAFACFFLSSFLFEKALQDGNYYVPAHVLAGLGAICFTLYSIVSILESGTAKE